MKIKNILIVGAGMMGKGVAQVFATHSDLSITLYDQTSSPVLEDIRKDMELMAAHNIFPSQDIKGRMERLSFTTSKEDSAFQKADLVVECVFEDMELKQALFAQLEGCCRKDTIFATNTSVMSPTEIAAKLVNKERLLGTHFWNPAHLIPLVEVVQSDDTDPQVVESVTALLQACGKKAIVCKKDVPGFVANRLQHALWREAFYMVQEGIADAKTVDDACKYGPGLRWPIVGPMENSDMVGIPLSLSIHHYLLPHLADNHAPSPLLQQMIDQDHLGFTTGEGWQKWSQEGVKQSTQGLREYLIEYNANHKKNEILEENK